MGKREQQEEPLSFLEFVAGSFVGLVGIALFLLDAGGEVFFGPSFHGEILIVPAWALLLSALYILLGPVAVKAIISGMRIFAGGIAAAMKQETDKSDE